MIKNPILDVTKIEPRLKHPTIFDHFDSLEAGESFVIHNDHDPKPLYYQLLGERGNTFTWEYLEHGPEIWQVRIAKPAQEKAATVGEIAAKDFKKAEVFKKLGIDFCCGGKKTLAEAAQSIGITKGELEYALEHSPSSSSANAQHDFSSWDLGFLADYITNVHHKYIREQGPIIEQLANKVSARHGSTHQELFDLAEGLHVLLNELYVHISKEENDLFPVIKQLVSNERPDVEELTRIIAYMEEEHEQAGEELRNLRALTHDYQLPPNACNSYTYLFEKIKEFENDLFQHIHLENNVLFPKVIAYS